LRLGYAIGGDAVLGVLKNVWWGDLGINAAVHAAAPAALDDSEHVARYVRTVDAVIKGRYDGNMVATGNVEITATGRVSGNIETDSLVISQGGFFNGNVAKIREHDVHSGPRPVHLVEDKRLGAQK
jgi:cytoskeletal protein CcmA (bactofilin family)